MGVGGDRYRIPFFQEEFQKKIGGEEDLPPFSRYASGIDLKNGAGLSGCFRGFQSSAVIRRTFFREETVIPVELPDQVKMPDDVRSRLPASREIRL